MPFDPRTQSALEFVADECARFRSGIESARDQMRAYLATHRANAGERASNAMRELGSFASGRIDSNRFANLFASSGEVPDEAATRIEKCVAVLDDLIARGDSLFRICVPTGGNVAIAADTAFGYAGRAFGAVLAFQAAKTGSYRAEQHDRLLDAFPFTRWNRSERLIAPPLVIEADGEDFSGDQVAQFIDGRARIIAVIRGASSAAPLARIITPNVLVIQAVSVESLSGFKGFEGPAICALVPQGAATFAHDPRGGSTLRDRLHIDKLPDQPVRPVGPQSVWQQREQLAQLRTLSALAAAENSEVDTLASWLLQASGLGTPQPGVPQA